MTDHPKWDGCHAPCDALSSRLLKESERSAAGVEVCHLERLTLLNVQESTQAESSGEDEARQQKWDRATDCPGKPLALSSRCIVGNAA